MLIRIIANAHHMQGGGELSSSTLARHLAESNSVICHPTTIMSESYKDAIAPAVPGNSLAQQMDKSCDILFIYANDFVYKIVDMRNIIEDFIHSAKHVVLCLNFAIGQAASDWFIAQVDRIIFLNSKKRDEFIKKHKNKETFIFAPPVDIEPFLNINTDYSMPLKIARHGRYNGKYDENETINLINAVQNKYPHTTFGFMAAPKFLDRHNENLKLYKWNQIPVSEFLSNHNLYWYRMPERLCEQGPRVIVEAMASGLPVISDRRDGPADRITAETGWLCSSYDEYYKIIDHIMKVPELLKSKGIAARQRAIDYFKIDKWMDAICMK